MKYTLLSIVAAAVLATPGAVAADKCTASADGAWAAGKATIEAFASGAKCESALAVLAIRDETGAVAIAEVYSSDQVMVLAGMTSAKDLEGALKGWIDPAASNMTTSGDLPEWKAGADAPAAGEFAFYPEEGVDQASYSKVRDAKSPMFCYVQGMESLACIVKDAETGGFFKIGVQSFPG